MDDGHSASSSSGDVPAAMSMMAMSTTSSGGNSEKQESFKWQNWCSEDIKGYLYTLPALESQAQVCRMAFRVATKAYGGDPAVIHYAAYTIFPLRHRQKCANRCCVTCISPSTRTSLEYVAMCIYPSTASLKNKHWFRR